MTILGIRREDKNQWERRAPLIPHHIKKLREKYGIKSIIQPSPIRIFSEEEYKKAGAIIKDDLSSCKVIFALKEIPIDFFEKNKTYVFFSHTIKGQEYNMPMLRKMKELECNLIDYEKITDDSGRRLVFFGRFAGLAGMVDTLWAFGQRMRWKKIDTPFKKIRQTIYYNDLNEIKRHLVKIGRQIKTSGIPKSLSPLIIGFAGYGNVSRGAQEIIDILPVEEIRPKQIESVYRNPSNRCIYKVVFKEEDMFEPIKSNKKFNLQEYYDHPERYRSNFNKYLPYLSILMNCIYWDERYPRLVTKKYLKEKFTEENMFNLQIIGDISADIEGAIECTKSTSPDTPVYVYNPVRNDFEYGYTSEGIPIIAVDNLPCELPRDSSVAFSEAFWHFVPKIMNADFSKDFKKIDLPSEIKRAVILHKGNFTPDYKYMNKFL